MTAHEVFERALRRELSVSEAAAIAGVAERDVLAWVRARRAGRGSSDEHGRKRLKGGGSTQVQFAVALYRERYTKLSPSEFARILESEHGILVHGSRLRFALRKEGLIPSRPIKAWRLAEAGLRQHAEETPPRTPSDVTVTANTPPPVDPVQQLGRELQALTDRVDRLNALARDRIVDWRRGVGSIESAMSAVAALREFILGPPK